MPQYIQSVGIKISELGEINEVRENDAFPINSITSSGIPFTKQSKINDVRQTLGFENAFDTVDAGIADSSDGEIFFVYEDSEKLWVNQFQNVAGVANAIATVDGPVRLPTSKQLKLVSELTELGATSKLKNSDGKSIDETVALTDIGTDGLTVTNGKLDTLLNSTAVNPVNFKNKKFKLLNGNYDAYRWFRNRGIASDDKTLEEFNLEGQSSRSTVLKMTPTALGDHIYTDYMKRGYIGKMTLDNTNLPPGTNQATSKNGQIWARYAEDFHFDDIVFKGGDVLSFCLGTAKNVHATNLKVDFQYRYPVGYSKSPLILGDFSEKCMVIGGYVRSTSPDGSVVFSGDLADNDQANDSKWAFINLLGLPFGTRANSNACMWQEGQDDDSNAHFIGMNYYANGLGHGISEKALGTDIGCTFRENQVRSVWNVGARYFSIGNHFINNTGQNTAGVANPIALGAIHNDNGRFLSSMGDYFSGNLRDFSDYTGGTAHARNSVHLTNNRHDGNILLPSTGNAIHLGIVNSQLTENSLIGATNSRAHVSLVGVYSVGKLGSFGNGNAKTVADIIGCTFAADTWEGELVSQSSLGAVNFKNCVIRDYKTLMTALSAGLVTFEKCTFVNVNFLTIDLGAKYIGCEFITCTNDPSTVGLNFAADSFLRPSSARCEIVAPAGTTYSFPAWIIEDRGVYNINIGGRGGNTPYWTGTIAKANAASVGTVTTVAESNAGAITVTWPANSKPVITFVSTAGTYYIKIG